jgi:hypothetical protein
MKAKGYNGNGCGVPLAMAAKTWPTVTAQGVRMSTRKPGTGGKILAEEAATWKTPHGFQNTDKRGKTAGGGGEFAKQVMRWQTPATDSFRSRGGERRDEQGLDQQARFWPTHTVGAMSGPQRPNTAKHRGGNLQWHVKEWPTPQAKDYRSAVTDKIKRRNARPLCETAGQWSTPTAQEAESAGSPKRRHCLKQDISRFSLPAPPTSEHGVGCSCSPRILNPRFVEHLMGVPVGWTSMEALASTDYAHWEMASCRLLRRLLIARSIMPCAPPPEIAQAA